MVLGSQTSIFLISSKIYQKQASYFSLPLINFSAPALLVKILESVHEIRSQKSAPRYRGDAAAEESDRARTETHPPRSHRQRRGKQIRPTNVRELGIIDVNSQKQDKKYDGLYSVRLQ